MAVFIWPTTIESGMDYEPRLQESPQGDGYTQRAPDGLNHMLQSRSVSFTHLSPETCDAINDFLLARGGHEAFEWTPPREGSAVLRTIGTGDGVRNAWQLMVGPTPVTSGFGTPTIYRTDWQGGSRTNYLLWSNAQNNAAYTLSAATITPGAIDPNGGTSAFTLTATGANGYISQSPSVGAFGYITCNSSLWIRRRTGTGVVTIYKPDFTGLVVAPTSVWQRVSASALATNTAVWGVNLATAGDAVDIAFGQVEPGTTPTANITTTAAAVTVTDGPATQLYPSARTNRIPWNRDFTNAAWVKNFSGTGSAPVVTANYVIGPDGVSGCCRVQLNRGAGTTASDYSILTHPGFAGASSTETISFWARALIGNPTINVQNAQGGALNQNITLSQVWIRYTLTGIGTPTEGLSFLLVGNAPALSASADFLLDYTQWEPGSVATSVIANTTAPQTVTDYSISSTGLVTFGQVPVVNAVLSGSYTYTRKYLCKKWHVAPDGAYLWQIQATFIEVPA